MTKAQDTIVVVSSNHGYQDYMVFEDITDDEDEFTIYTDLNELKTLHIYNNQVKIVALGEKLTTGSSLGKYVVDGELKQAIEKRLMKFNKYKVTGDKLRLSYSNEETNKVLRLALPLAKVPSTFLVNQLFKTLTIVDMEIEKVVNYMGYSTFHLTTLTFVDDNGSKIVLK